MSQNNSSRTSLSLVISTLLHGAIIAFLAIGPSYLKGVIPQEGGGTDTVDVTLDQGTSSAAEPTAAQEATPKTLADLVPVRQPIEPKVVTPPPQAEVKKPVVKKVAAQPLPAKKIVPVDFTKNDNPEAAKVPVEPQDALVAEDHVVEEDLEEQQIAAAKEEAEPLPAPKQEAPAHQEPEEKLESATAVAQQGDVQANSKVDEEAVRSAAISSLQEGEGSTGSNGGAGSGSTQAIKVTQNYLELRQAPGNKPPAYTTDMRLKKLEGRGQLIYYVGKGGEVTNIKLTRSTGSKELDTAALTAFKNYRFVPGQEGYTQHDFEFVLKGPAEDNRLRLRTSAK